MAQEQTTYWVQYADFSTVVDEAPVKTKQTIFDALLAHDWAAQRELQERLGDDGCPAGLGIIRDDRAIFHIMPMEAGDDIAIHHLPVPDRKAAPSSEGGFLSRLFKKVIPPDNWNFSNIPRDSVSRAIAAFLDHRNADVFDHLEATP